LPFSPSSSITTACERQLKSQQALTSKRERKGKEENVAVARLPAATSENCGFFLLANATHGASATPNVTALKTSPCSTPPPSLNSNNALYNKRGFKW